MVTTTKKIDALNSYETEFVTAIRNMTDIDRGRVMRYALACAEQRPRPRPLLHLVSGGKQ